jgi:hypothetical protein
MVVPSKPGEPVDDACGYWRKPWSPHVQGHWLEAAFTIALSKPFVESVSWEQMMDHPEAELPLSGLIDEQLKPKSALRRLALLRRSTLTDQPPAPVDPELHARGIAGALKSG